MFRGDESQRSRGRDVDIPWRRASRRRYYDPRPPAALRIEPRGYSRGAVTDDHLAYGWGASEPGCAASLVAGGLRQAGCGLDRAAPCVILDDQAAIVPRSRAHAYFGFYDEDAATKAKYAKTRAPDASPGPADRWGRACGASDVVTRRCLDPGGP